MTPPIRLWAVVRANGIPAMNNLDRPLVLATKKEADILSNTGESVVELVAAGGHCPNCEACQQNEYHPYQKVCPGIGGAE